MKKYEVTQKSGKCPIETPIVNQMYSKGWTIASTTVWPGPNNNLMYLMYFHRELIEEGEGDYER
jgi:hypothetical protein